MHAIIETGGKQYKVQNGDVLFIEKLDAAMDEIRMKFGNDKITRASIMNSNARIGRKAKAQMKNEKMEEP